MPQLLEDIHRRAGPLDRALGKSGRQREVGKKKVIILGYVII